jgi:DNA transposition AAA+ family ATPase
MCLRPESRPGTPPRQARPDPPGDHRHRHARHRPTFRHYPQLYSRLGFSHRYRALGRDELLFVLDRHWKRLGRSLDPDDFTDAQAIAAAERITRGNFRPFERLFPQIRRALKINHLETIMNDVIEAAASTLVIGS